MRQLVRISYNDIPFSAFPNDVVLDAALLNGVGMPHDCQAGSCGTCKVRVLSGRVTGGETDEPGVVLACRARAQSDLELAGDQAPDVVRMQGRIVGLTPLARDVVEVVLQPARPLDARPGQYVELTFPGYPPRAWCPTRPLDACLPDDGLLRFHVQRRAGGAVSGALGKGIAVGHKVRIAGPFGTAYFRRGLNGRLVLAATGTGFAPAWAIAHAALCERADRSILMIVGVASVASLYMRRALEQMAACQNVRILVISEDRRLPSDAILPGRPADYLPPLLPRDIVHAFGPESLLEAAAQVATAARAACHGEAFTAMVDEKPRGWLARLWRPEREEAPGQRQQA